MLRDGYFNLLSFNRVYNLPGVSSTRNEGTRVEILLPDIGRLYRSLCEKPRTGATYRPGVGAGEPDGVPTLTAPTLISLLAFSSKRMASRALV